MKETRTNRTVTVEEPHQFAAAMKERNISIINGQVSGNASQDLFLLWVPLMSTAALTGENPL